MLALATWLGALVFFPITAATAFSVLPTPHLAGMVVRNSLRALHSLGLLAGSIFLASSLFYDRALDGRFRWLRGTHAGVLLMLSLTAVSQFWIIPHMDALRASAGEMAWLQPTNPVRLEFDRLHARSVDVEGATLAVGLIVLYLTSRRFASPSS